MANNRTEFKTVVLNLIKAIVTISKHRQVLNDELADSMNFRKDVKSSTIIASGSANSIDFTTNDLVTIDGVTNNLDLVLTITNTEDGEDSKYIRVLKDAGKTVTFSGATDVSQRQDYIDDSVTEVFYKVTNKNGNIFIESISVNNDTSNDMYPIEVDIGDWDMDATDFVIVVHGISSATAKKIRGIDVIIRDDGDAVRIPINAYTTAGIAGGVDSSGLVSTTLRRASGGKFDSTSYNQTSFNRGWITYWIQP